MKQKYKIALKYYTETNNDQQLKIASNEIENFTESYVNFKWYFKFSIVKHLNPSNITLDKELSEFNKFLSDNEFIKYIGYFKYKHADMMFQQGNFNLDLIKYAIEKVLKKENEVNINLRNTLLNQHNKCLSFKNCLDFKENTKFNFSLFFSFLLILLSIALISTHYYLYMKNPLKFFQQFQRLDR
jgi:hypothetical protein